MSAAALVVAGMPSPAVADIHSFAGVAVEVTPCRLGRRTGSLQHMGLVLAPVAVHTGYRKDLRPPLSVSAFSGSVLSY